MKKYLGIDIGGTAVKTGLVYADGRITVKKTYSVDFDRYETPILTTVLKSTDSFLAEQHMAEGDLSGIGISATGQIDTVSGYVAGTAGHIKNWSGVRIRDAFLKKYNIPVTVLNDADCAAIGEYKLGAAQGVPNAVILTIGTGIGGGIFVNSRILLGAHGLAGEIGHFTIQCEGEKCTCGNTGCYEHYASTAALVRMVKAAVQEGKISWVCNEEINGKTVFLHCDEQPELKKIIEKWISYVAEGITTLVHIFNPEKVIIGGGICREQEKFIIPLKQKVLSEIMPAFADGLEIIPAKLANDAGMVGAVLYNIDREKNDNLFA